MVAMSRATQKGRSISAPTRFAIVAVCLTTLHLPIHADKEESAARA